MKIRDKKFKAYKALTWALLSLVLFKLSEGVFAFLWAVAAGVNLAFCGVLAYSEYIERKQNETTNKA